MKCEQGHLMVPVCEFNLSFIRTELVREGYYVPRGYTAVPKTSEQTQTSHSINTKYGEFVIKDEDASSTDVVVYTLFKCLRCGEECKVDRESYLASREKLCPKCGSKFWGIPERCWKCQCLFPRVPTLCFYDTTGDRDDPYLGATYVREGFGSLFTPAEWQESTEGIWRHILSLATQKTTSIVDSRRKKWWQIWK